MCGGQDQGSVRVRGKALDFKYPVVEVPIGRGRCLDVGCGSGRHRKTIEAAGYAWVGMDIDTSRGDARLIASDACALPFKSGVFSLVWMNCVLEHVQNPWSCLIEVHRVLMKEGKLVGVSGYLDPDSTHYCALSDLGLRQVLADTGFFEFKIQPATAAFPVILRKYLMSLIGHEVWSIRVAFAVCKLLLVPLETVLFLVGLCRNALAGRSISAYRERIEHRNEKTDRDFAAYLVFHAQKGTSYEGAARH